MNLQQLLSILRARFGWIALSLIVIVGGAAVVTFFLMPTLYTATTSVVISFKSNDPFEQQGASVPLSPGYVATQADIITSRQVALKVVKTLGLAEDARNVELFNKSEKGRGSINDWLADRLLKKLEVKPARESRVLEVRYSSPDPQFSAIVADAFAQAYIDTNSELNVDPARRSSSWLEEQLKKLRNDVQQAQAKLTAYQQKSGVIGASGERLDTETQRLAELTTQLTAAQAQIFEAQSRQLGENHPQYQRARMREEALRRPVAEQKAKILQLRKQYDDIAMLAHEVESAQRAYDAALQRYNQTSLESRFNQTNASILNKAFVPMRPSSPMVAVNLGVALVLALLLGAGLALGRELADRRVRTARDIKLDLGLPVVGVLQKARA